MAYLDSLGLTTSVDMGAFALPGSPDMQDAAVADNVESLNPWTMYDAFLALHREGKMTHRLRIFFLTQDTRPDVPILKQRLLNAFPNFGDDLMKTSGIGEFAAAWRFQGGSTPANYETALQLVAKYGWAFQQHTLSLNEDQFTTSTFEKVNAVTPVAPLHWSIAHVPKIDRPTLDRLKAIGAGVALHGWLYLSGTPQNGGPPYRTILDSGVHAGAGSDAAAVSVFDPWLIVYYMVTGKNSAGELINPGQQITRAEALRLYTSENGWYTHEENQLGTIEPGKLGDVAVLSEDYFDPAKVPDEAIRKLRSVLTVVGGKVVYDRTK
jgi:predicted amidohydrolase YtcJ